MRAALRVIVAVAVVLGLLAAQAAQGQQPAPPSAAPPQAAPAQPAQQPAASAPLPAPAQPTASPTQPAPAQPPQQPAAAPSQPAPAQPPQRPAAAPSQPAPAQLPQQPAAAPSQPAPAQPPEQPAASLFKPEELDQILAPIALYPDELIAQILTAATYPLEIVLAARWVADPKNAALKGDALAKALEGQSWDASVKSLVPFPSVLKMMSDKLDWTQKLGDAFLSQEADCLASVQSLRRKAAAVGTLKSTPQQKVTVAPREAVAPGLQGPPAGEPITMAPVTEDQTISIAPADPQVVYVPSYNPATAYGTWPYPSYPPYAFPPPVGYGVAAGLATGLAFGAGVAVVGSLWGWGSPNWGGGSVNINTNQFNSINRTAISGNTWQHNAVHRQGVAYRDAATRQRYGRETAGAAARRDYRGFEGRGAGAAAGRGGGGQLAGGREGGQPRAGAGRAGQPRAAARPAGQGRIGENRGGGQGLQARAGGQGGRSQGLGQRAGAGGRGNFAAQRSAFNPGNGAQARAFSQRGAASRQQFAGNFQRGGGNFQRGGGGFQRGAGGGGFQRAGGGGGGGFRGGGGARGGGGGRGRR